MCNSLKHLWIHVIGISCVPFKNLQNALVLLAK
uniref:Uncharacterized protein n=1 Tax=Arundo donax TaxID=35708 RepID=A0A0A9HRJ6_ARUDO